MSQIDVAVTAAARTPASGIDRAAQAVQGAVLLYDSTSRLAAMHEHETRAEMGRRVARLKGFRFVGDHDARPKDQRPLYFLPNDTIIGLEKAEALGIRSEADFLGGVVPHGFAGTKAITHHLINEGAAAPDGWSHAFPASVEAAVLQGYTCFSIEDCRIACSRLLQRGPVRVKPVEATGGRGQSVVASLSELEPVLAGVDPSRLALLGLVLEENLTGDVVTFSVGRVRLGQIVASYFGVQHLVKNNAGTSVYGGSDLSVARGDFDRLMRLDGASPLVREAIGLARVYDEAADRCFPGMMASRRNYDVICGTSHAGSRCLGVLEQSWRIGGATPAEILAIEEFSANPHAQVVHGCSVEAYGKDVRLPDGAAVYFHGVDDSVGPLTKYACLKSDERRGKSHSA